MRRTLLPLTVLSSMLVSACLDPKGASLSRMDERPPTVKESSPVPLTGAAAAVPSNATFSVTFSEEMEPRSLRGGVQLYKGNVPVTLRFTLPTPEPGTPGVDRGDIPYALQFIPDPPGLDPNTRHTLLFSTILTDLEGNPLEQEVRLTFQTAP
jgi:hypothetical protein